MSLATIAASRQTLPVTAWIEEYRRKGSPMNLDCLELAYQAMVRDLTTGNREDGKGRLRPSGIGNPCQRSQALSYFGAPQEESEDWVKEKQKGGTLAHYWFQAEGMSAGWLTDIEVEVEIPEWRLRGQMDGLNIDGSIFELKTISTDKFTGRYKGWVAVKNWLSAKPDHIRQVHAYMKATDADAASIVYMDRGEQAFREFRIQRDEKLLAEMDALARQTLALADEGALPDRLFGCSMLQDGWDPGAHADTEVNEWIKAQRWCDYRDVCRNFTP